MVLEELSGKEELHASPLSVRGHHLVDLAILMGAFPEFRGEYTAIAKKRVEGLLEELESDDFRDREYVEDCVGKNGEKAGAFEAHLRNELKRFWVAKDEDPFILLEGQPDTQTCKGCVVGEHCTRRYQDNDRKADIIAIDAAYVGRFITLAEFFKKEFSTEYVTAQFSDSSPQRVRKVTTTVGVAKEVIRASLSPMVGMSFLPARM